MHEGKWVSIADAAASLGVSAKTIRRRISDGSIDARRFGPRLIRVDVSSLEPWGRSMSIRDEYKSSEAEHD